MKTDPVEALRCGGWLGSSSCGVGKAGAGNLQDELECLRSVVAPLKYIHLGAQRVRGLEQCFGHSIKARFDDLTHVAGFRKALRLFFDVGDRHHVGAADLHALRSVWIALIEIAPDSSDLLRKFAVTTDV